MSHKTVRLPRRVISFVAAGGLATAGAAALATGWTASATQGDTHQVWVCAYVGSGDHRTLKPGKNPLLVDEAILENGKFRGSDDDAVIVGGEDAPCPGGTPEPTTSTTTIPSTTEPTTTVPTTEETTTVPTTEETTTVPTTEETTTVPTTTVPGGNGGGDGESDDTATTTVPPTTSVPPTTEPTSVPPTTTEPTTVPPTTTEPTTVPPTTTVPSTTVAPTTVPTTTVPPTKPHHGKGGHKPGTATAVGAGAVVPGAGAPHTGGDGGVSSGNRLLGTSLIAGGFALAAGEALRRRRENATR